MAKENPTGKKPFSRRKFLKRGAIVLGGTVLAAYFGKRPIRRFLAQQLEAIEVPALVSTFEPDFWFEIMADNTILLKSPKVEMGQGIFTGFAMLAAEELEVTLDQIKVEHANTATGAIDQLGTGGSNSTSALFVPLREVAATMREMLKGAAASQWGIAAAEIEVREGVCYAGNRQMTYAEIVAVTQEWKIPKTPALKPAAEFKYVGKEVKRIDLNAKVFGDPIFGIDGEFPDMLYAVAMQSPYIGGTLKSADTLEAETWPGVVKVIKEKDWIAVVAQTRYAAETALQMVEAAWDVPRKWNQPDIEQLVTVGKGSKPVNVQSEGRAKSVLANGEGRIFRQEYRTPMAAHAQMEPNGTVAYVEKDKATVIIGTQAPAIVRMQAAAAAGIKQKHVTVIPAFLGGGFGRRMKSNNVEKAVWLSKVVGKPVHLFYTREQEFLYSPCRPNTHHVLEAKINTDGSIEALTYDLASPDMAIADNIGPAGMFLAGADIISAGHGAAVIYKVKHRSTDVWNCPYPIDTGIWRSVGMFSNAFAIESFVNELSYETGKDPLALRIELLKGPEKINQRYVKVLETLAEKSGWNQPAPEGIGRGMAIGDDRKSIAAAVIDVVLSDTGRIIVKKVIQVFDPGMSINPEGVRMQVEGCIMMGISAALYEELTVKDGQLQNTNFHAYPMATLADTPEIEIIILQGDDVPYGVGEPPMAPIAPAIAAAVYNLTKSFPRSLPIKV